MELTIFKIYISLCDKNEILNMDGSFRSLLLFLNISTIKKLNSFTYSSFVHKKLI